MVQPSFVRRLITGLILASLVIAVLPVVVAAQPSTTILHVDTDVAIPGDGSSWPNAYADLQDALAFAETNGSIDFEIWVAAGTYYPTDDADRTKSFVLHRNVAVYGGFSGTEITRDARDWVTNATILSGDIGVTSDASDNSFQVVRNGSGTRATTILDGFTVTGGNANDASSMFTQQQYGGGIYINYAGGAYNDGAPVLANLHVTGNTASNAGGGIFSATLSPVIENVAVVENVAFSGAGITISGGSPRMNRLTISGNLASTFGYNIPTHGGGIAIGSSAGAVLSNSLVSGNTVELGNGGGVYFSGSTSADSPTLVNVTVTANSVTGVAGGVYSTSFVSPKIYNSIIWNNGGSSEFFHDVFGGGTTIADSIVEGGCPASGPFNCTNVIDQSPNFRDPIDPSSTPTTDGNFRLSILSPAIDTGNNTWLPVGLTEDLDGNPRIVGQSFINDGAIVDLGAYEAAEFEMTRDSRLLVNASEPGSFSRWLLPPRLTLSVNVNSRGTATGVGTYSSAEVRLTIREIDFAYYDGETLMIAGSGRLGNGRTVDFRIIGQSESGSPSTIQLQLSNGYENDGLVGSVLQM